MDGGVAVPRISDNADLRSGAGPSNKARTSNEFVLVGDAAGRSELSRTGACGVTSSSVAGKGDDASVSFSASANIGANNFIGKQLVFMELCAGSASLSAVAQKCGYRVMPVAPVVKTIKDDGGVWNTDQEHWTPTVAPYGKGKGKGKKGKGKKQINVLPKALQHKDNVSQDDHGRRLCFNSNLGKCDQAAHGAHCKNGYHLCCRNVLPRILFQNIKMVRRIDGSSASRSLLLKVRDWRTA